MFELAVLFFVILQALLTIGVLYTLIGIRADHETSHHAFGNTPRPSEVTDLLAKTKAYEEYQRLKAEESQTERLQRQEKQSILCEIPAPGQDVTYYRVYDWYPALNRNMQVGFMLGSFGDFTMSHDLAWEFVEGLKSQILRDADTRRRAFAEREREQPKNHDDGGGRG